MTVLVPMSSERFEAFAQDCVADHARDNTLAGRWLVDDMHERARVEFALLLPQGQQTPGHHFFDVRDERQDKVVGYLWFAVRERAGMRSGYVYAVKIAEAHRGRGHAKAALDLVDAFARTHGLEAVALHVFAFNTAAQALYRSVGYGVTGFNMQKRLRGDGA